MFLGSINACVERLVRTTEDRSEIGQIADSNQAGLKSIPHQRHSCQADEAGK